jgi:hypothetical protein
MTSKGLIGAASGKSFAPDTAITRGELAGVLSRMNKLSGKVDLKLRDVPATMPSSPEIHYVAAKGWLTADSDGQFHPNDPVTRAQFVTLVNKMLGRSDTGGKNTPSFKDVDRSHWAYDAIMEATQTHAVDDRR